MKKIKLPDKKFYGIVGAIIFILFILCLGFFGPHISAFVYVGCTGMVLLYVLLAYIINRRKQ